jgi:hypothetical protein
LLTTSPRFNYLSPKGIGLVFPREESLPGRKDMILIANCSRHDVPPLK